MVLKKKAPAGLISLYHIFVTAKGTGSVFTDTYFFPQ